MAQAFNKFYEHLLNMGKAVFDFPNDSIYALLTNGAPSAEDTIVDTSLTPCRIKSTSNVDEIAAGNGYTKGGNVCTYTSWTRSGATSKLILADPADWVASGGTIGPFRYMVLYNNSKGTASTRPAFGWYDYGASITLQDGEKFTGDLSQANGVITLA